MPSWDFLIRALDCINHQIIIGKLNEIGVQGKSLNWIKSCLEERWQYVSVSKVKTDMTATSTSIPQGSVLGPISFLQYVS